jgi:hypothetical protein
VSARTSEPPHRIEIEMAEIEQMLERIEPQISADDYACIHALVQTSVALLRSLQEKSATIARLRRLFGVSSSEKTAKVLAATCASHATDTLDGALDEDAVADSTDPSCPEEPASGSGPAAPGPDKKRKKCKGHGRLPASAYERADCTEIVHPHLRPGQRCPECGRGSLSRLAQPAVIVSIFGQPPLAARCYACERLRCSGCGAVFTARPPKEARGPKYDASAVSMMALLRYGTGGPLHRLERMQASLKTPLPASTQWQVVRDHAPILESVHAELRRRAASGEVLHNDDTHVRILALMGLRRDRLLAAGALPMPERTGLFTTGIVSVTKNGPILLFESGRSHAGENLASLLEHRDTGLPPPIQMCDGLERNRPKDHAVVCGCCLAHGRRHIVDEVECFPAECRYLLEQIGLIFEIDAECRAQGKTALERLAIHQAKSAPILDRLQIRMQTDLKEKRVEPNSGLGKAYTYLLKRWEKLTLYLRVPGAPLDNNICERALKMAIRHRNSSLFYRSTEGARIGDLYMSLICTTVAHRESPLEYIEALLRHDRDVAARPAAWLPWTFRETLAALSADAA